MVAALALLLVGLFVTFTIIASHDVSSIEGFFSLLTIYTFGAFWIVGVITVILALLFLRSEDKENSAE